MSGWAPGSSGRRGALRGLLLLIALGACSLGVGAVPAYAPAPPQLGADSPVVTVVLLHGLGRTHRSMGALERALEDEGYRVVNLGYPSREHPISVLVDTLAAELDACCAGEARPPSFVTHSLGGILLRAYQASHGADRIGRVVMLSPPNQGSEVVDRVPVALLRLMLGPAALQLGTDSASIVHDLPTPDFELGIITGNATLNPLFSWWLPGEDDGKVTVASAWVEGADEFLVVPYAHTWIMQRERVIEQVVLFMKTGRFGAPPDQPARRP